MKPSLCRLMLCSLLVNIGLAVVSLLIDLVTNGVEAGLGTSVKRGVAVLGDLLVGFLGSGGGRTRERLLDVVGGVPGKRVSCVLVQAVQSVGWSDLLDGIHCERGLCLTWRSV